MYSIFFEFTEIKGGEMDIGFGKGEGRRPGGHLRGPPILLCLWAENMHMPCFLG